MAHNVYRKMSDLRYFWFISLMKTLAGKHKTSLRKIFRKYSHHAPDGRRVIVEEIKRKDKKPLVAIFGRKPIEHKTHVVMKEKISKIHIQGNGLVKRLLAHICELCGKKTEVEGHHLRKLKDLKRRWKGHKEKPAWVKRMIALHRKSLFVCKKCHNKIHAGIYDGNNLAKSLLESCVSGKLAGTVRREVFGKVPA